MNNLILNIDKLVNQSFYLNFYEDNFIKGKPIIINDVYISPEEMVFEEEYVRYLENHDFWDFSFQINDIKIDNCADYDNFQQIVNHISLTYELIINELQLDERVTTSEFIEKLIERLDKYLNSYYTEKCYSNSSLSFKINIYKSYLARIDTNNNLKYSKAVDYVDRCISFYLNNQKKYIENLNNYLKSYILKHNMMIPNSAPINSLIKWKATDTDLLELIVALLETKSITIEGNKLTRKEAIKIFEQIFSIEIKDAESKLTRATERKINSSPYLSSLKDAFDNYCKNKLNKSKV